MEFQDAFISRRDRYSLGIEAESGRRYLAVPVTNGLADYEEYYELNQREYDLFIANRDAAVVFADECRQRAHDDLLIRQQGWNRGVPMWR